ncbi:Uncharacterised protein [uncultured archaeon]|nr:Uncharacterised protein [uncultured archaeon]
MGLLDLFGKKDASKITKGVPFDIRTSFNPVRISAHRIDRCDLEIRIKNLESETVLTSLVIETGQGLGLEQMGIQKAKEIRIGYLGKGEEYTIIVPIWSNTSTNPGDAVVKVIGFVHYRTYAYVLNSVKKNLSLRIV